MTHHKDSGPVEPTRPMPPLPDVLAAPAVEPYTVEEALASAEYELLRGGSERLPNLWATLRAYAAQGKRIEELEGMLTECERRRDNATTAWRKASERAEKAEAALIEAAEMLAVLSATTDKGLRARTCRATREFLSRIGWN